MKTFRFSFIKSHHRAAQFEIRLSLAQRTQLAWSSHHELYKIQFAVLNLNIQSIQDGGIA
jgi:hypothetical protein